MESGTDSSSSRGGLVIPLSVRGLSGMDRVSLEASMKQIYVPTYGPRLVVEMARLNLEISRAEQDVEAARGEENKKDARRALKHLNEARKDILVRRDQATQRLVEVFDPVEARRLFASSIFKKALLTQCDPASVASAVLAIHRSRCDGKTSIFDTAAVMPSETWPWAQA